MKQKIQAQLEAIEKSNAWIISALEGEKRKNAYRNMVNCRRKLNKKKFTLENNLAAAIYGESQVGKSYLISSLLSDEGRPFTITGENGAVYNFIEEINPPGGGSESTGLVSRFSINYKPVNPKYPVKAVLLSPADLVLVLCDSFYNDINLKSSQNLHLLSSDEISEAVYQLKDKFKDRRPQQTIFGEDDALDMQDYFEDYFQKADRVIDSAFFEEISLLITKAQPREWKDIFSLLWNRNEIFTTLFGALIAEYEKLDFAGEVYLPLESVLYAYGTLLDVKRLREIYAEPDRIEPQYTAHTTVFLRDGNREIDFAKSYLCALSAELVFGQSENLLADKPFLKETDLLDFPGARSRMEKPMDAIETKIIPDLLLRGKVAYLFNKYSDAEKINILIFCAKHEQTAQRIMPRLLDNWINKVVGKTPEKRELFVRQSKIPPLFIIGTFFNVNLQYNPQLDKPNDNSSLNYRWLQRFVTTLEKEYFEKQTYPWLEQWTSSQPDFNNIFLLRDFAKSESISNLFTGYNQYMEEREEVVIDSYPDFRFKLRQSFIDYPFVKRHFTDPAESWDEAASINRDGTKLIIKKLTLAADNINNARREKLIADLNEVSQTILSELLKYYHSSDKDRELQKAKYTVGRIQYKLDTAFSADGIKNYGQLMKELMVDESSVLELYRRTIDDIEHRDVIMTDIYSVYRIHTPVRDNDTAETYFARLCTHYEITTEEQKQQFCADLEAQKIDLDELIRGSADRIKNNALQLAETLLDYWIEYIAQDDKQTIRQLLAQSGSSSLQDISEMFQKLFKKLGIAKRIAEKIRRYVEGRNKTDLPYEIIADMSAELLNKCINTVGFEYLDESEINDLLLANRQNNLGLIFDRQTDPQEKSVGELFTKIENWTDIIQSRPGELKSLPSYRNYLAWYNRLKVGFISVYDIPNYDVAANERLGTIIKTCETIKY